VVHLSFLKFIQEKEILDILLENPILLSASNLFRSEQERTISDSGAQMKHVYVFQREFATVDPETVGVSFPLSLSAPPPRPTIKKRGKKIWQVHHLSLFIPFSLQIVGTDEATTCVGLVIRNRNNGLLVMHPNAHSTYSNFLTM
jgi:protein N-terminal asparagine amidohydrolase